MPGHREGGVEVSDLQFVAIMMVLQGILGVEIANSRSLFLAFTSMIASVLASIVMVWVVVA